jgi:DNA-binding transcriptional MerR regulator
MSLADDVAVEDADDGEPGPRDRVLSGRRQRPPHRPWNASLMLSSHDRQSRPSSAPEVNAPGRLLTIGDLARRAGVSASALRYYEEVGLLPPPARISGQRRYPESAAAAVAVILLLRDAGFTLAEQRALMAPRDGTADWREIARRKLAELDERIARAQAAREAISHGLRCPRRDSAQRPDFQVVCPDFRARLTTGRASGSTVPSRSRDRAGRH